MSYILEALRKMERQRRHESEAESWVEDVSAVPEDEKSGRRGPGLAIIAISIFFGLCGVLTGMLLYQENDVPSPGERVAAQNTAMPRPQKTAPLPAAIPSPPQTEPKKEAPSIPPPRGVTLSAIKEVQPPASVKKEAARDQALPPILSDDVGGAPDMDASKAVQETVPEEREGLMGGAVLLKPEAPLRENNKEENVGERPIDLTRKYKLTSTGEMNDRKYATIERNDYFIGDNFMGMVISDIERDRVYLRKDGSSLRYVIIFRY